MLCGQSLPHDFSLRRIIYKRVAPFAFKVINTDIIETGYNLREENGVRGVRCGWRKQTRFVKQSMLLMSINLYNDYNLNISGKYFEDEADFRDYVTEKLKNVFGNNNI